MLSDPASCTPSRSVGAREISVEHIPSDRPDNRRKSPSKNATGVNVAFGWRGHLDAARRTPGHGKGNTSTLSSPRKTPHCAERIARSRTQRWSPFALAVTVHGLKHVADQLHGEILETQRGAVDSS